MVDSVKRCGRNKVAKSALKVSTAVLLVIIAQNVAKYLGYFCKKINSPDLSKSGHTDGKMRHASRQQ